MAKQYTNDISEVTAQFPDYVPDNRKNAGDYDPISEPFTVPSTPDADGKYRIQLDYAINPTDGITVVCDGNTLVNRLYGISVASGQCAINYTGIPIIEFHAGVAGLTGTVDYKPLGSVRDSAWENQIGKEIEALQSISGGVTSVNGYTGVVSLSANHLTDVDNYYGSGIATGSVLMWSSGDKWTPTTLAISDITNLQTTLNGKANTSHTHVMADITDLDNLALDDLSNMTISSPSNGQFLRYGGGTWSNANIGIGNVTLLQSALDNKAPLAHSHTLDDLSDVYITSQLNNQVLSYNGTDWVNKTLAISDITNLQSTLNGKASSTHNHTLDSLSNVNISSVSDGQALVWDNTTSKWVNETITAGGSYVTTNTTQTITGAKTFENSNGATFKTNSASSGFRFYDRPETPGRQLNFASLYPHNTNGSQAVINLFQAGQTRSDYYNTVLAQISLWPIDPSAETSGILQNASMAMQQDNTGSNTGRLTFFTFNYGANGSTINPMPIIFNAGNTASYQIKCAYESSIHKIGFFGATPKAKPTVDLSGADTQTIALAAELKNLGLINYIT